MGTLVKLMIGAFFVALASQMGEFARDIVQRARESVQASELATLDANLHASWAMEKRPTRGPKDQAEFEAALNEVLTARGGRDVTRDRWSEPYVYDGLSDRPLRWRITSKGRDKALGTDDDLVIERREDRATLNRHPVEIAEQAAERVRERDRRVLEDLRRLMQSKDPQDSPPAPDTGPDERRELEQSLEQLDRILKG